MLNGDAMLETWRKTPVRRNDNPIMLGNLLNS